MRQRRESFGTKDSGKEERGSAERSAAMNGYASSRRKQSPKLIDEVEDSVPALGATPST
jgi:hypothetical protein